MDKEIIWDDIDLTEWINNDEVDEKTVQHD